MSLVASCLCVRNILRENLSARPTTTAQLQSWCRLMPDDRPAPNCGQEAISIYGGGWIPKDDSENLWGLHEEFAVVVAVTHRTGDVPFDRIGEVQIARDEDLHARQLLSIEARIREINRLIHVGDGQVGGQNAYQLQNAQFESLLLNRQQPYEKLSWHHTDPWPKLVGPDHFHATDSSQNPTGILMRTFFKGAPRLHNPASVDAQS